MSDDKNENVAKWALVGCATFMLLIQTLASSLAVIGYDEVIRADAKAKTMAILGQTSPVIERKLQALQNSIDVLQKELVEQKVNSIIRFEKLELNSHARTNK
jgi:hypothetical protein